MAAKHEHEHENRRAVINRMSRAIGHMESVKGWWRKEEIAVKF